MTTGIKRLRAFAKINLTLRVLGVRADGDHELETTFQSLALHDTLTIRSARGPLRIECDDPACPTDRTNLVWRAAARVWRASGRRGAPRGVVIRLTKRIPIQAGLGGGSSDAAAALRALGRRWQVRDATLRRIAASLGADVPYFFEGGTVLGFERGDVLFPLVDQPPAWVVLVLPNFGVSTKDAYAWFDADVGRAFQASRRRSAESLALRRVTNDLQKPVAKRHPEIARLVATLERYGASEAAMSGSGSAVFGLFARRRQAARAAGALASATRRVIVTRTLDRTNYQRLVGR
ncbi:MAG: 4-(cytidine 5'-diphospho)-2-C-methyl-D-erythritol kinase [Acidobacteria bacterium]|nr:4-(cytidine 5'-diphospho)-2-C-methyl-D-erythritol kinase [Acidobacteriota bacterium]